jgi:hypothetical protein
VPAGVDNVVLRSKYDANVGLPVNGYIWQVKVEGQLAKDNWTS